MKNRKLKNLSVALNLLVILLFFGYFLAHGLPKSLILWSSATLWLVSPIVNLFYIFKSSKYML